MLGVFVVLVVTVVSLLRWQWNNVQALSYLLRLGQGELETKLEENEGNLRDALGLAGVELLDIGPEQIEQVTSGAMTAEAMASQMMEAQKGKTAESPTPEAEEKQGPKAEPPKQTSPPEKQKPTAEEIEQKLSVQVATMYVLKASFVGQLETVVNEAKQEYIALPAAERTAEKKREIVYSHFNDLSELEKQCDTQVAAVVEQVRKLLAESGRDLALADQIQETYEQEKSLKKAYYISELNS